MTTLQKWSTLLSLDLKSFCNNINLILPTTDKQRAHFIYLKVVPHLRGFQYRRSHYRDFWLMGILGDFRVSRGPPTLQLTQILRNAFFFKSQYLRKAGTLCSVENQNHVLIIIPLCPQPSQPPQMVKAAIVTVPTVFVSFTVEVALL